MISFKYSLDRSSRKFHCPRCNKKSFVKFMDKEMNYLSPEFGRCDREHNCGYFFKPDQDRNCIADFEPKPHILIEPSFIDRKYILPTFKDYQHNNLFKWLILNIGYQKTECLINIYGIGIDQTSPNTKDWVIFWQYDINNRCRSGKIIKYTADGHRCKKNMATWFHKKSAHLKPMFPDFNLMQCLFGEHLLGKHPNKPVAIVESEKTAVIASIFIDRYIWLACGGKGELNASKLKVLKNRSVTLFPDLGAFDDWNIKAEDFGFNISSEIEKVATPAERAKGLDIGDYLIGLGSVD